MDTTKQPPTASVCPAHCKARVVKDAGPEIDTQARCEARDRDAGRDSIGNKLDDTHPWDTRQRAPLCAYTRALDPDPIDPDVAVLLPFSSF